jgi:hypothetical protein
MWQAFLNEVMRFRDLLVVLVTEGENAQCKLEAVGTGTTVEASEPLDVLDFGTCLFLSLFSCIFGFLSIGGKQIVLTQV